MSAEIYPKTNATLACRGMDVFCKYFLDKSASYFWTLLHVQFGQSCKWSPVAELPPDSLQTYWLHKG